jgi:hypothetical protein
MRTTSLIRVAWCARACSGVKEVEGRRNANAGGGETAQRIDLGALPRRFGRLATEARALGHRAGLAGVLHPPVLGVVHRLPEAAVRGLLVDLGAAHLLAAADHVHGGFLAAHQLPDHGIDQTFVDQRLQTLRSFHAAIVRHAR